MLTKEQLQERANNIAMQIEQSLTKCNDAKNELERMYANHNGLLGAQVLANQLLEACAKEIVCADTASQVAE